MGIQASAAPVSIAEYSSPAHRGAFLATIAFSFTTGMLIAHIFGTVLYWRTAALACGSCYAISLIIVTLSPETPPWLAAHGHYEKCKLSFAWLRGQENEANKELEILLNSQKNNHVKIKQSQLNFFMTMLRKKEFYKPTLIMIILFVMFQMSGVTVIPSYTVAIMEEVTGKSINGYTAMLLVDLVRFAAGILACIVLNKFKRRSVLFFGVIVTVLSLSVTSLLLYLRNYGIFTESLIWLPTVPMLTYIFGKTLGILSIPWAIAGEIFPLAYRSIGSAVSGMTLSMMFFVVVKTAPSSFSSIGVGGTFCLYAISVSICASFLYFLLPETKGKTLHEIEYFFKGDQLSDVNEMEQDKMLKLEEG